MNVFEKLLCGVLDRTDTFLDGSLVRLADHIDDFEFYPGVYDTEDVAREWLSSQPYLQLSGELEVRLAVPIQR